MIFEVTTRPPGRPAVYFYAQRYTPPGNEIRRPAGFSGTWREEVELYHPPGEQQTRPKRRSVIGDVLIVLLIGSRA